MAPLEVFSSPEVLTRLVASAAEAGSNANQTSTMPTPDGVDLVAAHFASGGKNYCQITVEAPPGSTTTNLSLVAVMDTSGSMGAAATVDRGGQQVDVGFSVLDITKHAMKTVVETLKDGDKLSVVAFSNAARIVSPLLPMTEQNKAVAKQHIVDQVPSGCTNMWDALDKALEVLQKAGADGQLGNSLPSILFFTDGLPSEHLLPQSGILQSLKERMAKITNFKPTIHTFGFGYDLDTPLLVAMAQEGDGAFSFIPDSGFVGTVLVHAVANLATCVGAHAMLEVEPKDGAKVKRIIGYDVTAPQGAKISIDSIHFGQHKQIIVELVGSESSNEPLAVELTYVNAAGTPQLMNGTVPTVPSEASDFKKELLRSEFTELLYQILKAGVENLPTCQQAVNAFLDKNGAMSEEGVYADCEGQVKIAVSQADHFKRWGNNYISSLMMAHRQQRCNNFKDKGVAKYGGDLFDTQRDLADEIFTSMPPPLPSRKPSATADSKADASSFSMSNFNDADAPCFHEDAMVHLADGSKIACKELKKGHVVAASDGKVARVVCVVRTESVGNVQDMVTLPSGLRVTPWHPVRVPGSSAWAFPADLAEARPIACSAVYSFVLESEHVLTIEGVECVALGHGFEEPVAKHEYYGTERVIRDLAALPGFEEGALNFRSGPVVRGVEGKVVGFDQSRLRAAVVRSDAN